MIANLLSSLNNRDADTRLHAAENLADLLQNAPLDAVDATEIVQTLIDAIRRETKPENQEALTNTLATFASSHIGVAGPWEKLAESLPTFQGSSLENALTALGFSRNPRVANVLREHLSDRNHEIRHAAAEALTELVGPGPRG